MSTSSHVVDANVANQRAALALRDDGSFAVRRDMKDGSGWSDFYRIGGSDWKAGDAAILGNGDIHIIAVNSSNELYTRVWYANDTWSDLTLLTSRVDSSTAPTLAANDTSLALALVRTDSKLSTYEHNGAWSGSTDHYANWVSVDIDLAPDGDLWFIGTKNDGTLRVRKQINDHWSGIKVMESVANWSQVARPSISASSNAIIFAAVKEDGRLYTQRKVGSDWMGWVKQGGTDNWVSADVALTRGGQRAWLIGVKDDGKLYTHESTAPGSWEDWLEHGYPTWDATAAPSITLRSNGKPTYVALKADGRFYTRSLFGQWSQWLKNPPTNRDQDIRADWDAPEWIAGATAKLEDWSLDDITVSWGAFYGGSQSPQTLEITLYDSNGNPGIPWEIDPMTELEYTVNDYFGPLDPNETYALTFELVNEGGRSSALELHPISLLSSAFESTSVDTEGNLASPQYGLEYVEPSHSRAAGPSAYRFEQGVGPAPCMRLTTPQVIYSSILQDPIIEHRVTTRVCTDGRVITERLNADARQICADDTIWPGWFRDNPVPFFVASPASEHPNVDRLTVHYVCNFSGEISVEAKTALGETLQSGEVSATATINLGDSLSVWHTIRVGSDGNFAWEAERAEGTTLPSPG